MIPRQLSRTSIVIVGLTFLCLAAYQASFASSEQSGNGRNASVQLQDGDANLAASTVAVEERRSLSDEVP